MNNLSCPIPNNINPLSPNGFMFTITKLPELSFFCQQVNLPGVTIGEPAFSNPLSTQPIPGETLTFDTLQVQFLVDENMDNYKAIHAWIIALGFPENYSQYTNFVVQGEPQKLGELAKNYSDATLSILGNTNTVIQTLQFIDMFPVSIDSLVFQSTNQDVNYLIGNATFRYAYYKFI